MPHLTMWLREGVASLMLEEASAKYPLETGGVFMGYWADDCTAVVTQAIGPGPKADHQRHGFAPDQEWQTAKIAEYYQVCGRRDTYLGDWHTHPDDAGPYLSRKDRAVIYRIATAPSARAPTPLMTVLLGSPDNWSMTTWRGRAARRLKLFPALDFEAVVTKVERARS
jgi:integrative and conjugative element protein (TIGR02256 family)